MNAGRFAWPSWREWARAASGSPTSTVTALEVHPDVVVVQTQESTVRRFHVMHREIVALWTLSPDRSSMDMTMNELGKRFYSSYDDLESFLREHRGFISATRYDV